MKVFILFVGILLINSSLKANEPYKDLFNLKVSIDKATQPLKAKVESEDFDTFFKKFETDKSVQLSRINFPLRNVVKSEQRNSEKRINKNDWKFTDFTKINKIRITKHLINKKSIAIVLEIADTGVHVNYIFLNMNGKWMLNSIVDESD